MPDSAESHMVGELTQNPAYDYPRDSQRAGIPQPGGIAQLLVAPTISRLEGAVCCRRDEMAADLWIG